MNIKQGTTGLILAVALIGLSGCGPSDGGAANDGPSPDTVTSMGAEQTPTTSASPAAPSGTSTTSSPAAMDNAEEGTGKFVITVEDFKFKGPKSVPAGASITIVNKDTVPHTVTSEEEGVFDVQFEGGETVTFTAPGKPGEYPYICAIHPAMMATLVVE